MADFRYGGPSLWRTFAMADRNLLAIMKHMSRPKTAAVKDIDINNADILGQKYRYVKDVEHLE